MQFFTINFILTFDVQIIAMNVALKNVSTAQDPNEPLFVEIFGEPAMDKYIMIGNTHHPALCAGRACDEKLKINKLEHKC